MGCLFVVGDTAKVEELHQAARPQSVFWLQGGGPQHPEPLHGRDGEGVLVDRRRLRHPGRRGGGVGGQPGPGDRQQPRAAERPRQPPRGGGGDQRGGELHLHRGVVQHGPGDALPPGGPPSAHGEAPVGAICELRRARRGA